MQYKFHSHFASCCQNDSSVFAGWPYLFCWWLTPLLLKAPLTLQSPLNLLTLLTQPTLLVDSSDCTDSTDCTDYADYIGRFNLSY